jgi:hypothetical protein
MIPTRRHETPARVLELLFHAEYHFHRSDRAWLQYKSNDTRSMICLHIYSNIRNNLFRSLQCQRSYIRVVWSPALERKTVTTNLPWQYVVEINYRIFLIFFSFDLLVDCCSNVIVEVEMRRCFGTLAFYFSTKVRVPTGSLEFFFSRCSCAADRQAITGCRCRRWQDNNQNFHENMDVT